MKKLFFIALTAIAGWYFFSGPGEVSYGPGVMAAAPPLQTNINTDNRLSVNGYSITPLSEFELTAKVLSRKDYSLGREADLSPTDLALGWGRMSDERVLEELDISQSGRWYRWRGNAEELPLPRREIETHSANMHIIPGDDYVADQLDDVAKGDIIRLRGSLVRADAADGWRWTSSLTRDDTGGGACELFLVEQLIIEQL